MKEREIRRKEKKIKERKKRKEKIGWSCKKGNTSLARAALKPSPL